MREITRSVKVALKCHIAVVFVDVDFPNWTLKVHLVAFAAIVSNIFLRMRKNGYLTTSGKSFCDVGTFSVDFLHLYAKCHSILRLRFPYKVRNFGDFIFAFYKLKVCRVSTSVSLYLLRHIWSCRVTADDTLRDLVTLTFDLMILTSSRTWRVTWSTLRKS